MSLEEKTAFVLYDAIKINPQEIIEIIDGCGFEAKLRTASDTNPLKNVKIKVLGMVCNSCVDTIQSIIGEYSGIKEIKVSLVRAHFAYSYKYLD